MLTIIIFVVIFLFVLQPENSLPESCVYDLVAVVVHHGSGWEFLYQKERSMWNLKTHRQRHTSFLSAWVWGLDFVPSCCGDKTVPLSLYSVLFDQPITDVISEDVKPKLQFHSNPELFVLSCCGICLWVQHLCLMSLDQKNPSENTCRFGVWVFFLFQQSWSYF